MTEQPSIECPVCGMVSYNTNDIVEGYCGHCHDWTRDPVMDAARASNREVAKRMEQQLLDKMRSPDE
jgi:ribosomal protein L37E